MTLEPLDAAPRQAPAESTASGGAPGTSTVRPGALIAIGVVVVAYAALSHYSSVNPHAKVLGAALSIGPVLLVAAVLLWRWTHPVVAVISIAIVMALLYRYRAAMEEHYPWADLVQQSGAYALIGISFARTLFGGRIPMCTRLAAEMHGSLVQVEIDYTRRVTFLWALFYLLLAVLIGLLFFCVSLPTWSLFVNFVAFGLIALLCVLDYLVRRYRLPRRPETGLSILQRILFG